MKKLLAVLLSVLLCVLMLTACGDEKDKKEKDKTTSGGKEQADYYGDLSEDVGAFMKQIDAGKYADAITTYNNKIVGDYALEIEASEAVTAMLNRLYEDILSGEKTGSDSKKVLGVVDRVLEDTDLVVDGYEEIKDSITEAVGSKAAYLAGQELEKLKNYGDAIVEYQKVIEADSNYAAAQEAITRCATTYKEAAFADADAAVAEGDYLSAITLVKGLAEVLPEDDEVLAKVIVYEKTYLNSVLDEAEQVFVTPAEHYDEALAIINGALQHFSDSEELLNKKAYYESYAPVNLFDMDPFKGEVSDFNTCTDTYGTTFEKCFYAGYGEYAIWYETDVSFFLDKKYNTFTATVFGCSSKNDAQYMIVEIYTDGKVSYQKVDIADNGTQPFNIEVDVTGVSELRIVLDRNDGSIGRGIGMTNMILQKTVK